jgi:PAS domain S-box-containing protein
MTIEPHGQEEKAGAGKMLRSWSLRRHLIAVVVVSLLPVLGILLYTNAELKQRAVEDADASARRLARNVARQHQQNVENTRLLLITLSRIPAVQQGDTKACNRIFRDIRNANPLYLDILLTTRGGIIVASALSPARREVSRRKYFLDAVRTGDFSSGEYVVGLVSRIPAFHYAYPVRDAHGNLKGVVAASMDLTSYGGNFSAANLPEGSVIVMSDYRHRNVLRLPDGAGYMGSTDRDEMITLMAGGDDEGTFMLPGRDNMSRLYAFQRLRLGPGQPPYLYIRVGVPRETALAPVVRIEHRNILLLAAVFVLSLSLAWLTADYTIMRRFNRLVELARKLGRGELASRSGLDYAGGEIGLLAESLDGMAADIQERRQQQLRSEEALRLSGETFRSLVEATRDLVFTIDREGRCTYLNPRFEAVTGFAAGEMMGQPFSAIVAPEYVPEVRAYFRREMGGERMPPYRVDLIGRRAGRVPVEFLTAALFNREGIVVGRCGVGRDVSERIEADRNLRESEEKYRTLFERMAQGVVYLNADGEVFSANPAAEAILGRTADQLRGKTPRDLDWKAFREDGTSCPGDEHPALTALRTGKAVRQNLTGVSNPRDGRVHWILVDAVPRIEAAGKRPREVFATFTDITALREAEEAARMSEQRFGLLVNNMAEGVAVHRLICDDSGRPADYEILDVNPRYEQILSMEKTSVVGRKASDVYGTGEAPYLAEYAAAAQSRKPLRFEVYYTPLDKHFNISVIALKENEFATIFLDITDRKRFEAEKAEIEKRLLQSQKMEAIGTLAGGIAHDFNNILSAMIGYAEMALEETEREAQENYIGQVLYACDRARTLVAQILDFSRQAEQKHGPADIGAAVREGMGLLRASLPTTIRIEEALPDKPLFASCDATQVHQVLLNLCTNAAHAMRDRGGVLKVGLTDADFAEDDPQKPPEIAPGGYAILTVTDNGPGIPQDIMGRIFDPFFTTKGPGEGTGLGLSMVYGIVKGYGGAVAVRSDPGRETTVTVWLPRLSAPGSDWTEPQQAAPTGQGRILFVDDEEALVDIGEKMFTSLGYEVTATASSIEALEFLRSNPDGFDLLITDLTMPGLTGIDLALEVLAVRPSLPVILCTGFSERISGDELHKAGIREVLSKPVPKAEFARAVKKVMESPEGRDAGSDVHAAENGLNGAAAGL